MRKKEVLVKRYHLRLDGVNHSDPKILIDKNYIEGMLMALVKLCDMNALYGPVVVKGQPYNPGLTGFVVIDYSAISIHTFSKTGQVFVDVFSCKPFDNKRAEAYIIKFLSLGRVNKKYDNGRIE